MKIYSSLNIESIIVSGFLSAILAGALFLQAIHSFYGISIEFLDSIYMATSAVCVTGLAVVDVSVMPFEAQFIMLLLMEIGGVGVLTVTTALFYLVGKRVGVTEGIYCAGGLGLDSPSGIKNLVRRVLFIALFFEGLALIPLFYGFVQHYDPNSALWMAIFHSVSAFCNAGFSIVPGGTLEGYKYAVAVPGTIMLLITLGGTGFLVLYECIRVLRKKQNFLSPIAILVLRVNVFLIMLGTVMFFFSEQNASMDGMSLGWRFWNSLFQSVTTRTAGFNMVNQASLSGLGVFVTCILMIIGAAPGSTGGGIKTTTFGVLLLAMRANAESRPSIIYKRRGISSENISAAMTVMMNYLTTIVLAALLLGVTETVSFKAVFFEIISAIGTVGLSLNATTQLSEFAHFICILLMFWGRVGIMTFIYGMVGRRIERDNVTYADINIPVG